MDGYYGIILDVNLTDGSIKKTKIPDTDLQNFIGGRGLGAKILFDRLKDPNIDALSPDNVICFMPGPFCGLPIPSSSRTTVVTKSPRTSTSESNHSFASTITYTNMGGFFGPELRFAGYDGLVVTGKSPKPVYIKIEDDKVEIVDATAFSGMGTDAFDREFHAHLGDFHFESCYVGPAAERLVPMSSVLNTAARAAGRGGAGCVMGSKNLKAIAVRGTKVPNIARHKDYLVLLEGIRQAFSKDTPDRRFWREGGTTNALEMSSDGGTMAVKNYSEGTFKDVKKINTATSRKDIWKRDFACFSCQLACKKSGMAKGAYGGLVHDGPEYETGTMLGANLLISDLAGLQKLIFIADDYGLDIISAGNTIGFLMEAYEKGLIDIEFLDGIHLTWGNVDAAIAMLHKLGNREGIGEKAAMGVKYLASIIGKNSTDFSIHVKGHELAAWNVPKAKNWTAISYATANRGACHMNGSSAKDQDDSALRDSLGACSFASDWYKDGLDYRHFLSAITGVIWSEKQFAQAGERIYNLEKMFNYREGFRREDDTIPERFFIDAATEGPAKGIKLEKTEFNAMLDDYYTSRQWDMVTSRPSNDKLIELGLQQLCSIK